MQPHFENRSIVRAQPTPGGAGAEQLDRGADRRRSAQSRMGSAGRNPAVGNLENRNGKLVQIILAGQPELDRKLDAPNLRQLKQRIVLRCNLQPFTLRDAVEYILSRLERAGIRNQTIFSEELMAEVHLRAQGIPRVINALCDNLLLTAFASETKQCSRDMLDEVCKDLRL